jgi:hypothetical protein
MTRRSLGFIFLGLGLAALAGGILFFFFGIFGMVKALDPVARITSPAEVPFRIHRPGAYTIWHDHQVRSGPSPTAGPEALPAGMGFSLTRDSDGKEFPLFPVPASSRWTTSTPNRESIAVGRFEPDEEGRYTLKVTSSKGATPEFSLTEGDFRRGFTQAGLRIILTCLLGFFGVVFFAFGLVFVLMKKKPPRPRLSSPAS